MATSWTSSSGSSLSYTTTGTESGTTTQTLDYDSSMGVSFGSEEETQGGTAIAVGGDAFAVGEETIATGDIDLEITDMGTTVVASGSSTFEASSESSGGDTAYASADTTVAVSSGGKIIAWDINSTNTLQTDDYSEWSASSTTGAVAIYDDAPATDQTGSGSTTDTAISGGNETDQATVDPETAEFQLNDDPSIWELDSGNIATLDVDAVAYGQDTFISVDASILTVENQLSTVTAMAVGAVG
jgi:hypothetical protein